MKNSYTIGQEIKLKNLDGHILTYIVKEVDAAGSPIILEQKEVAKELPPLIFMAPLVLNGFDNTQEPSIAQLIAIAHDLYIEGYDKNVRLIGKNGKWWFQTDDDEWLLSFYQDDYIANRWLGGPFTSRDLDGVLALSKEAAHANRYKAVLGDKGYKIAEISEAYISYQEAIKVRVQWNFSRE